MTAQIHDGTTLERLMTRAIRVLLTSVGIGERVTRAGVTVVGDIGAEETGAGVTGVGETGVEVTGVGETGIGVTGEGVAGARVSGVEVIVEGGEYSLEEWGRSGIDPE